MAIQNAFSAEMLRVIKVKSFTLSYRCHEQKAE